MKRIDEAPSAAHLTEQLVVTLRWHYKSARFYRRTCDGQHIIRATFVDGKKLRLTVSEVSA